MRARRSLSDCIQKGTSAVSISGAVSTGVTGSGAENISKGDSSEIGVTDSVGSDIASTIVSSTI